MHPIQRERPVLATSDFGSANTGRPRVQAGFQYWKAGTIFFNLRDACQRRRSFVILDAVRRSRWTPLGSSSWY
jgi:hypothetical protein